MRNKRLVLFIISIIIILSVNIPLLAEEPGNRRLESTSFYEENDRESRYVNHRFSFAEDFVLDEEFDVTYFRGRNDTKSVLTVKAYNSTPSNTWDLVYSFHDNAEYGEIKTIIDHAPSFYYTTKEGCCGAENSHSLFRLDNGKLLFTYSGDVASIEIHNLRYGRIASYHSNQAYIEPVGLKKGASGIFTFSTPEYNIVKIMFYVGEIPEWTPAIQFMDSSTGKGSKNLRFIGKTRDEERNFRVSKLSIKLDFDEGDPVIIPINNDNLDIEHIKCPNHISYEIIPNEILLKAKQLDAEGYKLYKSKKDQEAIGKYQQAIALIEDPVFYYNYGNSLTNVFKYQEAINAYNRALDLGYDPWYLVYYNLACAYSRLNNISEGYRFLHLALREGYQNIKHIEEDPDLANLRKDKDWTVWFEKEKSQK